LFTIHNLFTIYRKNPNVTIMLQKPRFFVQPVQNFYKPGPDFLCKMSVVHSLGFAIMDVGQE